MAGTPAVLAGLDLGTTACKCLLFDESLNVLGSAREGYPLITLSGERIEQDARQWWEVSARCLREAVSRSGLAASSVKAVSVSSQGIAFVPVDRRGEPLRNALSWLDTRGGRELAEVTDRFGEERLFALTGKRALGWYVLPKLLWLAREERGVYARTDRIAMALDFVTHRLTGEWVTDHTMASGTMFYDVRRQEWAAEVLDRVGLDARLLPEVRWSGTPVGRLTAEAAEATGLDRSAMVCLGGQDQKVAALGAGIDLGRTTVSLGTAMAVTQKGDAPLLDPRMRIPCFSDLLPGRWVLEGSGQGCAVLDWARGMLYPGVPYETMLEEADGAEAGDLALLPFHAGAGTPHGRPEARGGLLGMSLATDRAQVIRAVLEGVAFQIRQNLDVMEELGKPAGELRLFGGGSRGDAWCRIIAEATGRPAVTLTTSEAGAQGAAMLAGMGCGVFGSAQDAAGRARTRARFEPRAQRVKAYGERFARYRAAQDAVLGLSGGRE